MIFKIILASILCGLLGLERDLSGKDLGVRSCILLAGSVTVFMLIVQRLHDLGYLVQQARVMSYCIGGVGFLGSGFMIKDNCKVTGITTSCLMFSVLGISFCCGYGFYDIAITLFILSFITLCSNRIIKGAKDES